GGVTVLAGDGGKVVSRADASGMDVCWSPDGSRIAVSIGEVRIFHSMTGERVDGLPHSFESAPILTASWSSAGALVACGDREGWTSLWDTKTDSRVAARRFDNTGVRSVRWSPTGELLATGGGGGIVTVWKPSSNEVPVRFGFSGDGPVVRRLAWSSDG